MGHTPCQATNRFQFLGLVELFFKASLLFGSQFSFRYIPINSTVSKEDTFFIKKWLS